MSKHHYFQNQYKAIASLLLLVAVPLVAVGQGSAEPQVITITPTAVDTSVTPGKVTHGSFQVIDQGKTDYDFTVYANPYSAKGEDYTPDFNKLATAPDIVSWFHFSMTKGHVTAGQSVTVGYDITVPANTQPGDYYAAAFAQTKTAQSTGNNVILNERVGELFYLKVPGNEVQKGSVASWKASMFQAKPLTAELRQQNSGSVHYNATVQVIMSDIFGHPKYTLNTIKVILPQSVRKITVPWQKTPTIGIFKVSGSVNYLGKSQTLPTHYVIVAPPVVRFIVGPVIILLVLLLIYSLIRAGLQGRSKPKPKATKVDS